jgi:hypothetical protein
MKKDKSSLRLKKKVVPVIEEKRQEMVESAFEKGFTHEDTVRLSQELDKLLNGVQEGEGLMRYSLYVLKKELHRLKLERANMVEWNDSYERRRSEYIRNILTFMDTTDVTVKIKEIESAIEVLEGIDNGEV